MQTILLWKHMFYLRDIIPNTYYILMDRCENVESDAEYEYFDARFMVSVDK